MWIIELAAVLLVKYNWKQNENDCFWQIIIFYFSVKTISILLFFFFNKKMQIVSHELHSMAGSSEVLQQNSIQQLRTCIQSFFRTTSGLFTCNVSLFPSTGQSLWTQVSVSGCYMWLHSKAARIPKSFAAFSCSNLSECLCRNLEDSNV